MYAGRKVSRLWNRVGLSCCFQANPLISIWLLAGNMTLMVQESSSIWSCNNRPCYSPLILNHDLTASQKRSGLQLLFEHYNTTFFYRTGESFSIFLLIPYKSPQPRCLELILWLKRRNQRSRGSSQLMSYEASRVLLLWSSYRDVFNSCWVCAIQTIWIGVKPIQLFILSLLERIHGKL